MSDQPTFTVTFTRDQLVGVLLGLDSDVDRDVHGFGHMADVFLHYMDPAQFPVHPDDAPPAIATGPTTFQAFYPGSPQYYRADVKDFMLLHDKTAGIVKVLGKAPFASGSLANRPVVHTVAVIDGDVPDAIAAASAAVDHMMAR